MDTIFKLVVKVWIDVSVINGDQCEAVINDQFDWQ